MHDAYARIGVAAVAQSTLICQLFKCAGRFTTTGDNGQPRLFVDGDVLVVRAKQFEGKKSFHEANALPECYFISTTDSGWLPFSDKPFRQYSSASARFFPSSIEPARNCAIAASPNPLSAW